MSRGIYLLHPTKCTCLWAVSFPKQGYASMDGRAPSVLYYDGFGVLKAIGAETLDDNIKVLAEDESWHKVE